MLKSNHTPGDWKVEPDKNDPQAFEIVSEEYGTIAYLHDPYAKECDRLDELAANARLIARAPVTKAERDELLEALEVIQSAYGRTDNSQPHMLALAIKNGIEAIKKVRGKDKTQTKQEKQDRAAIARAEKGE